MIIKLEGCPRFLSKGVIWVKTTAICRRDNEFIWQEQLVDGTLIDSYACNRLGCSWCDHDSNFLDIKKQLTPFVDNSDFAISFGSKTCI